MSQAFRVLQVRFESRTDFDQEWENNLQNGGIFIPGSLELLYGEPVIVFVDLPFAGDSLELEGRVAQTIPVEFEANGGCPGVALELREPLNVIRERFESVLGDRVACVDDSPKTGRVASRCIAHVRARVSVPGIVEIEGRTRNLSLAGVLVAIVDDPPPVGQDVKVTIVHPTTAEERSVPGVIARHDLDVHGSVRGVGIEFAVEHHDADETLAFLGRIKASEHARRLGGITGAIETLGLNDLVMSFGRAVPRGRFTLMNAGEVGTIHVADGWVKAAQMGAAVGVKALARMAEWTRGHFEFHANLEHEGNEPEMALPIEAALLEAARFVDESSRYRDSGLAGSAFVRIAEAGLQADVAELSKVESQILDLSGVGMNVSRLLDTIQEPDALIERAMLEMADRGTIRIDSTPN